MGSVADNRVYYEQYDWSRGGAEWSVPWGGTRSMWLISLYPRLRPYLPADRVVEIGCGHGRLARILHAFTRKQLVLCDIVEGCVDACHKTFETSPKTVCLLTDGESLESIEDHSVDLVVSFYSLIAANAATIRAYIQEFRRILSADGAAFLHHSNAATYYDMAVAEEDERMRLLAAYRDITTSADDVRDWSRQSGLLCIRQECVDWDIEKILTDCFSTIVRPESKWARPTEIVHNSAFRAERELAALRANLSRRRMHPRRPE